MKYKWTDTCVGISDVLDQYFPLIKNEIVSNQHWRPEVDSSWTLTKRTLTSSTEWVLYIELQFVNQTGTLQQSWIIHKGHHRQYCTHNSAAPPYTPLPPPSPVFHKSCIKRRKSLFTCGLCGSSQGNYFPLFDRWVSITARRRLHFQSPSMFCVYNTAKK